MFDGFEASINLTGLQGRRALQYVYEGGDEDNVKVLTICGKEFDIGDN